MRKLKIAKSIWQEFNLTDMELANLLENINLWEGKIDQRWAKNILKYKSKIPIKFRRNKGPFYRGLRLDKDIARQLSEGKIKIKKNQIESWAKEEEITHEFAQAREENEIGVVFEKEKLNVILDLDAVMTHPKISDFIRRYDVSDDNIWLVDEVLVSPTELTNKDIKGYWVKGRLFSDIGSAMEADR